MEINHSTECITDKIMFGSGNCIIIKDAQCAEVEKEILGFEAYPWFNPV